MKKGLLVIAVTLTTLASAQLTNTVKTTDCNIGGDVLGVELTQYSNWQYKDTSGVTHDFPGTTEVGTKISYTCGDGAHTCTCGANIVTSLDTLSTDQAYYLKATGGSGTATATSAGTYDPAYQVVSIIYSAPGNKGQNGFTDTTVDGATTTVGSTFTEGESITFSGGFLASASFGFGGSVTTSSSSAFQETFSDATGAAIVNQTSNPDAINHNLDFFLIWLNPKVTVIGVPPDAYGYSVGVAPTANGETPDPDIIGQNAVTMEANPAGVTTIEPVWLNPRPDPATGQSVPGLASICKNLNVAEYNAGECTLQDQCGCTPADFAPILEMDPLLYSNGTSNPISPYPGYANPLAANVASEATCSTIPTPADSNCRYVSVPESVGSTTQETLTLAGPGCSFCGNPSYPFQQADNQQTTNTLGFTVEEDVTFSVTEGILFTVTETDTWKWTQSESTGLISGNGYTAAVTLLSNTNGCGQTIPVFEDTVYHTFLFMQPGPTGTDAESCTTATATPTFSPAAGTYTSAQTVTISTPDGAYIYYTTNGTTPTTSSTLCTPYPGTEACAITVSATETLKAISFIPGWSVSSVGSAAYTIE